MNGRTPGRALTGAAILLPDGLREGLAILVEGELITAVVPQRDVPSSCETTLLPGGVLAPGFIDTQVNGGGGVLFNDETTVEGVRAIAAAHRRFGTTALLPTLISDTPQKVAAAIDAVDAAIAEGVPGVVGVHIEGPFLNPAKRGIHDEGLIRAPDETTFALLTRPGRGRRMVTLAPERAPQGFIRALTRAGVLVSAGHSLADYDATRRALDEGLAGFTHLFNAMTMLGSREPGMVGAALDDRASRFGLICDGLHVHPASMRVALHARGVDGVMLVTDAMPSVGSDVDRFTLNGREIRVVDGRCLGADGTLAGAHLDMAQAVANAREMLGVDLAAASRMASANPAAFLGLERERGVIQAGLRADLVHLGDDWRARRTWMGGHEA